MYKDIILQNKTGERFYTEPNKLWDKWDMSQPVMEDCPFEREANQIFVDNAFGDVLIGGLGIGLIIKAIEDKVEVKSITVIELHQEVIDLIPPFGDKVTIILGDAHTFQPLKKYDTIWLDDWTTTKEDEEKRASGLFVGNSREQWKEKMLPFLNQGGFIGYWKLSAEQNEMYLSYLNQYATST